MAISFFSWSFMCPHFFFLFFSQYMDLHVSIFFFDSPCLIFYNNNWRERSIHIVEHIFCGMDGWYNANFSQKNSKEVYNVHVNLDHESMTKISFLGSQQFDKAQCKNKQHMCIWFSRSIIIWLLVGLWHIKEELRKGFSKFSNK